MHNKILYTFFSLLTFLSCTDSNQITKVDFGTSRYYPSFLWSPSDTSSVIKKMDFEFSEDALAEKGYATFRLVNLDGHPLNINKEKLQFSVNGIPSNGEFRIESDLQNNPMEVCIEFRYLPGAIEGDHKGYLMLVKDQHSLDRIEDVSLEAVEDVQVMEWGVQYISKINPLAVILLWILAAIVGCILFWFIILRRLCYPVFTSMRKQITIQDSSMRSVIFTGFKLVVFTKERQQQSSINRLFTGKILYVVDPEFISPIVFKPRGKKGAFAFFATSEYRISPNPIPKVGRATITNNKTKRIITLN